MKTSIVVDAIGEFCPVPITRIAKAIKTVDVGESVLLKCTDPGIFSDIPAWCKAIGHELVSVEQKGDLIEVLIRRQR